MAGTLQITKRAVFNYHEVFAFGLLLLLHVICEVLAGVGSDKAK